MGRWGVVVALALFASLVLVACPARRSPEAPNGIDPTFLDMA
jgi:hypothetical protein